MDQAWSIWGKLVVGRLFLTVSVDGILDSFCLQLLVLVTI